MFDVDHLVGKECTCIWWLGTLHTKNEAPLGQRFDFNTWPCRVFRSAEFSFLTFFYFYFFPRTLSICHACFFFFFFSYLFFNNFITYLKRFYYVLPVYGNLDFICLKNLFLLPHTHLLSNLCRKENYCMVCLLWRTLDVIMRTKLMY